MTQSNTHKATNDRQKSFVLHIKRVYITPMGFEKLSDIFFKMKSTHPGLAHTLDRQTVFQLWEQLVKPPMSHYVHPIKLQDSTLFLKSEHPGWTHECNGRKAEILRLLNQALKANQITLLQDLKIFHYQPSNRTPLKTFVRSEKP